MKNDSAAFKTRKDINAKTIFDDAKAGDAVANKLLCEYFDYLAEGIANIVNIFRPEAVLIGGGLSAEGDYITKPIEQRVNKLIYGGTGYAPVAIKAAILGNDAGLIGAAKLAMK
jgi:glucokinase